MYESIMNNLCIIVVLGW